jgi:hypothetical protein
MDLYAQELKVWKECAGYRESLRGDGDGSGVECDGSGSGSGSGIGETGRTITLECKVPGAFEW